VEWERMKILTLFYCKEELLLSNFLKKLSQREKIKQNKTGPGPTKNL
jgi:hypothetical protein